MKTKRYISIIIISALVFIALFTSASYSHYVEHHNPKCCNLCQYVEKSLHEKPAGSYPFVVTAIYFTFTTAVIIVVELFLAHISPVSLKVKIVD